MMKDETHSKREYTGLPIDTLNPTCRGKAIIKVEEFAHGRHLVPLRPHTEFPATERLLGFRVWV